MVTNTLVSASQREGKEQCTFSSLIHLQGQHKANQTLIYVKGCHKEGLSLIFAQLLLLNGKSNVPLLPISKS